MGLEWITHPSFYSGNNLRLNVLIDVIAIACVMAQPKVSTINKCNSFTELGVNDVWNAAIVEDFFSYQHYSRWHHMNTTVNVLCISFFHANVYQEPLAMV